jgi:hypothetical protein
MEITLQNVYKCDHCGKKQFRKGDMTKHEKWCKGNPNNRHKCFQYCNHLIKEDEEYEGSDFVGSRTIFKCGLTEQKMFSYIAERKRLPIINENDNIRMPVECDKYEDPDIMLWTI